MSDRSRGRSCSCLTPYRRISRHIPVTLPQLTCALNWPNSGALTHPFALFGYHVTGPTGSRRLRAEGRADQAKDNIKQAGAKIKDASGH